MLPLLLLLPGDPADLLRDLADPDIEVRQAAASELYRRGGELRQVLVEARRDALNVEARSRIDDLLKRLEVEARIRGFGGDNRIEGFGLSLRSDRVYGSGPFRLTVEAMNLEPGERVFPGFGTWDVEMPELETRTDEADARLIVRQLFRRSGFRRTAWGRPSGAAAVPVRLGPGESTRAACALPDLPPGDYEVRVEVERIPGAEDVLRSNTVRLTVRK